MKSLLIGLVRLGLVATLLLVVTIGAFELKTEPKEVLAQTWESTVVEQPWGYLYTLGNGDIVEVGDNTTTDFKAMVRTIRRTGVSEFSLGWAGGTFTPSLDGEVVSFNFNKNIDVEIYPVSPSDRLPEGGIEYNIELNKKPAKPTVTLDIDWVGITWQKILPLNEEYDQAACEEEWGVEAAPYVITQTTITGSDSVVYKARAEYEVNSYLGTATTNYHKNSGDLGGGVTYTNVSRSYLYIHRGQMTDALGDTAWVEDINIDEQAKTITFDLPTVWLRSAEYPVSQVCGVDPAYTEDIDSWDSSTYGGDGTWSNYDLFTNHSVPKVAVAEVIMSNQENGVEALTGIRTDGSSLSRYVDLHEAEGGGVTTCRMFVLTSLSGLVETYSEDISDANLFYLVGYWENIDFAERMDTETPGSAGSWQADETLVASGAASRICHFLLRNQESQVSNTMGVRDTSSALNRYVLNHEQENDGDNVLDMITKADASYQVDLYTSDITNTVITNAGYFGPELDFVELFQAITSTNSWTTEHDLSAYLDEDGRIVDFLLGHHHISNTATLGARDGDDATTLRYIVEHEAEDDGSTTGEVTGFGISVTTSLDGHIHLLSTVSASDFYLMGYFKPAATGTPDISNTPAAKALGIVVESSSSWSSGSAPSFPLDDGECFFTITNSSGAAVDITIEATNFTGGNGWTLSSSVGEAIVVLKAGKSGDANEAAMVTVTTSPQSFITSLADSGTKKWEVKLDVGTFTDGVLKESTITLTATLS